MAINLKTFFPGPTLRTTLARPTAVSPVAPTQGTRGGEPAQTRDPRGLGNLRKTLSPIRSNTYGTRGNTRPAFGVLRPPTTGVTIGGTIKRLPPSASYQHAVHALGQPGASRPKFRPLTSDQGMRPTVLRLPPQHARTSPGAPPPSLASSASGASSIAGTSSVGREGSQFPGGSTNSSGHQSHGYNLQTYRLPDRLGNSPTSSLSDLLSLGTKESFSSQVSDVPVRPARLRLTSLPANSWTNNTGHVEKIGRDKGYLVSEHAERSYLRPELEGLPGDRTFPVVPKMQRGDVTRLFATQEAAEADFFRRHPSRHGEQLATFDSYRVDLNNVRITAAADNYVFPGAGPPDNGKLPSPGTADTSGEIHVRTADIDTTRIKRL